MYVVGVLTQIQIEAVIGARIEELRLLEVGERSARMRTSYQDKRDELEALLLRIMGLGSVAEQAPHCVQLTAVHGDP